MERTLMTHILKSVGVMSIAKITGLIYGGMGLLFMPFFLLFALAGSMAGQMAGQDKFPFAGVIGVVVAIAMPFIYGIMGFIAGALGALLYNLLAKWMGGFELELELTPARPVAPYPIIPQQGVPHPGGGPQ
jgi:hypothetical protein